MNKVLNTFSAGNVLREELSQSPTDPHPTGDNVFYRWKKEKNMSKDYCPGPGCSKAD